MGSSAETFNGGTWRLEGEDIVQCTKATKQPLGPMLLFGDINWTDYDLVVESMPFEGLDGFKILFRVNNSENLCGVGFGSYGNRFHDVWWLDNGKWKGLSTASGSVEFGYWHHVQLCIRGKSFRCTLNGIPQFELASLPLETGKIGLSTWGTLVRFRNIQVRNPRGDPLWRGLPKFVL
jgi:hypothetical protein